jgi:hypothetical protein
MLQTHQDTGHRIDLNDGTSEDPSIRINIERFKKTFASYAYFCRFWGCGAYLSSVTELENYEMMHSGGIKCPEVSCPFSSIGFATAVAFKGHMRKYHLQKTDNMGAAMIRRRYVCSGVVDGVAWGCKQRFVIGRELQRRIDSRRDTSCDHIYMKLQQVSVVQLPSTLSVERSMAQWEYPLIPQAP